MAKYRISKIARLLIILVSFPSLSIAQTLQSISIDECYELARMNYPMIKQLALVAQSQGYNLENANKNFLPQLSINGQASYQSAVTSLPISIPNLVVPTVSKDQYKIYAELYQSLSNAPAINLQKELIKANTEIEQQSVEVELYKIKERINHIFFGVLLINEQLTQTALFQKDIENSISKINAAIKNGTATRNNADLLSAELLKVAQRNTELKASRNAYAAMLEIYIGKEIGANTQFEIPETIAYNPEINRPELKVLDLQNKTLNIQQKKINNRFVPNIGLFAQGGYGRPALNMLNNDFALYGIGGLKLNWNLSAFYTSRKDKFLIKNNAERIALQKETFLRNTEINLAQQNNELSKYDELLKTDKEIIEIRERIKQTANVQLENGLITAIDFLSYLNAEDQAKQNYLLHSIQKKMVQYTQKTISGN